MNPQPLHTAGVLHGLRVGQQHTLDHSAEVTQVKQIVGLGWSGQQVDHRRLVDVQSGIDHLWGAGLEVVSEAPVDKTDVSQNGVRLFCV